MGPFLPGWEPDSVLSGPYTPDSLRNSSHVNDPTLTAMLKEQQRTKDVAARKQHIFASCKFSGDSLSLRSSLLGKPQLLPLLIEFDHF